MMNYGLNGIGIGVTHNIVSSSGTLIIREVASLGIILINSPVNFGRIR